MNDDRQLIRQFLDDRSESAFSELVARYIDLVYAAALRAVNGDTHLAQDVTQTVFIDLARKAVRLPAGVVLAGWLHRHACYTAATAVRTERRRQNREQIALEMKALDDNSGPAWELIAPHLDAGLNQLNTADRHALVLRFLQRQDFRAVGTALGVSEDAAQKRVTRAVEKLRSVLEQRGLVLTGAALAAFLATETITAAPAGFAVAVTGAAFTAATETGTKLLLLKLMAATKLPAGILGALAVACALIPLAVQQNARARLNAQYAALQLQTNALAGLQAENTRLANSLPPDASAPPVSDPQHLELLRLRAEVSHLQRVAQDLTRASTNQTLSHDDDLAALRQMYADRLSHLKQLFADNPALAVPELPYLSPARWMEQVEFDRHTFDPDGEQSLSTARSAAQLDFGQNFLFPALRQYTKNNDGQFPTALAQLTPYFQSPVADSVLQDWEIVPGNSLPGDLRSDAPWVITQKAPVDAALDQRMVIGPNFTQAGMHNASNWGPNP